MPGDSRKIRLMKAKRIYYHTLEDSVGKFLTKLEYEIYAGGAMIPEYLKIQLKEILDTATLPKID